MAIGGSEALVRHDVRMGITQAPGDHIADQEVGGLVGEAGGGDIEQRQVNVLAQTRSLPLMERGEDAVAGIQPGENIGQGHPDFLRPAAGLAVAFARNAHEAAHGLDQKIVAGKIPVGSRLSKAGDGAVDESRVEFRKRLVVDTELARRTRLEVLQHHVSADGEFAQRGFTAFTLQIQRHGAFAPVCAQVVGGFATVGSGPGWSPVARIVTGVGILDLDNVRAEIRQQLACPRPGENPGQVENGYTAEGSHNR